MSIKLSKNPHTTAVPKIEHTEDTKSDESTNPPTSTANQSLKHGHGRLPHSAYANTIEHHLSIPDLKTGDPCPLYCGGKLYSFEPGIIVRVQGQNLAAVHKYWVDKLRCALCSHIVSADIPNHIGHEKYDAAFKAILALQKYYVAIPFHRQAYFQSLLGVPLPASTQWQPIKSR